MKRKDGVRVKCDSVEYAVVPHIMVDRSDSMNMIELNIPEKPIGQYLIAKHKEGFRMSHLSVVMAAYARMIGEFPYLNRFIVNRKIYARNELAVGMVVLKGGQMDNGTMSKVNLDPSDTIFDVNRKMAEYIEENKSDSGDNKTDKLAKGLLSAPGLLRVGVSLIKWADKHSLLPVSIIEASPFHASMTVSNLASIRTNHIFHHVYNFGTTSMLMTLGNMREVPKRSKNGEIIFERCIPFGVVMDERICSGSYYAQAFRSFRRYLADPSLLETPPETVIRETPYRK